MTAPPQRRPGTLVLVWLAFLLPLLALLGSQFGIHCDEEGGCSAPVRIVALLTIPLLIAWLAVLAGLAVRGCRRLLSR